MSLPVRGAWIEIYNAESVKQLCMMIVAPRAGSVD